MKTQNLQAVFSRCNRRLFLIGIILLFTPSIWAQTGSQAPPRPVAYYPLDIALRNASVGYARYNEINVFDAAGKGRHGKAYGEQSFRIVPFFELTAPALDANLGAISIPYPFQYSNARNGMSVAFWLHHIPGGNADCNPVATNYFRIRYVDDSLLFQTNVNGNSSPGLKAWHPFQDSGWYYICIVADSVSANLYSSYVPNAGSFQPAASALQQSGTTVYAYMPKSGQQWTVNNLVDNAQKSSGMRNFRFFNKKLTAEQLNFYRVADFENATGKFNGNNYVMQGAAGYYPLDQTNYIIMGGGMQDRNFYPLPETVSGGEGTLVTDIEAEPFAPNRFGAWGKALTYGGVREAQAQPFFYNYDSRQGYTLSFWVKQDSTTTSPDTGIAPPFTTQHPRKMFYAKDAQGRDLLGMQQINDRIGTLRYALKDDGSFLPWYFWLYDPVSFKGKPVGWYHIILVQDRNWMKVYLAAKDSVLTCDCDPADEACLRQCSGYYSYLGTCDLNTVTAWGFGGAWVSEHDYLDDFRIYTWPMSEREVRALHDVDAGREQHAPTGSGPFMRRLPDVPAANGAVSVFPNPNRGAFTVSFALDEEGPVAIRLIDLQGRTVYETQQGAGRGSNTIDLQPAGVAPGFYFLTVSSGAFTATQKLTITN